MKKILKKTPTEPTLGEQYGAALALKESAVSVFKQAQDDLLQAETELSGIASDAGKQAQALSAQFDTDLEAMHLRHAAELDELEAQFATKHHALIEISDMAYGDAYTAHEKAGKLDELLV